MGKPTGFMEYGRKPDPTVAPEERIKNYKEFHAESDVAERKRQGARCMNCGVPFCQSGENFGGGFSGCPLHNLIPEWNDEVFRGNWKHALARLTKTNNFPEFTGRVCPALCEAACVCGRYDDPVTVRDNELAVIETGFNNGYIKPAPPEVRSGKTVAVIGSGPSGLAVADSLNRRGHTVTVYEKSDRVGGLLMYGIPNMKLDKSVIARREALMKAEGVKFVTNADVGGNVDAGEIKAEYDAVVLCCGSRKPRDIKPEGRANDGVYFAVDYLTAATKSVLTAGNKRPESAISAKGKNVVIVGGGDTGNDCVATAIRQGCKSVVQLEMMPMPPTERAADNPWPQWKRTLKTDYGQQEAIALFGSDPRRYQTTVKKILGDGKVNGLMTVSLESKKGADGRPVMSEVAGTEKKIPCDMLLIAAGFVGAEDYIAKAFGVNTTARGTIDADSYKTSDPKVFAAGDVRRGQSLVVWAIAEGRAAAKAVDEYLMGYSNM